MRFDNLYNSDCLQIDMILLMFLFLKTHDKES
uniref:Uncharacterized protein n=1 Tax=Anguilla anguilla TaxID=7936 RepID=A0A0E9T0L8_ANGAN